MRGRWAVSQKPKLILRYTQKAANLKPDRLKPVSAISQSISQSGSQPVIHLQQPCVTPTRAVAKAIVPSTFFNLVQRSLVLTERIAASGNEIAAKETKSTFTSGLHEPRYYGRYFHWSLKTHLLLFLRLGTLFGLSSLLLIR